jgi:hypothetical protein
MPEIVASIRRNLGSMRRLWLSRFSFPFVFLAMVGVLFGWRGGLNRIRWALLAFAFGPFLLVLVHTEPRYFYAQVVILVTCGAASLLMLTEENHRMRVAAAKLLGVAACGGWLCALPVLADSGQNGAFILSRAIHDEGVQAGMRVCTVADGSGTGSWAWLQRVRVVGEMPVEVYRRVMAERRQLPDDVESAFEKAGCDVAVAVLKKGDPAPEGWRRASDLSVYVRMLR